MLVVDDAADTMADPRELRDVLDELRPPTGDELRTLQQTVADLEQRVAALEQAQATPKKPAAKKPAPRRKS